MARETRPARHVFLTLDGMRGIAAVAVIVYHCQGFFGGVQLPSAYLAVDLFFVMSGFVIAHAYDAKLAGDLDAGAFMRQRLIRLYPLYLVGLAIALLHVAAVSGLGLPTAWTNAGLTMAMLLGALMLPTPPSPGKDHIYPLNDPSWSLFYELGINAAFATWHDRLSLRTMLALMAGAAVALIGFAVTLGQLKYGVTWPTMGVAIARVTFSFLMGVVICRLLSARGFPRLALPAWIVPVVVALLLAVPASGTFRAVFDLGAVLVVMPALVVLGAMTEPERFKNTFAFLGRTSYALYIVHVPLSLTFGEVLAWSADVDLRQHAPWGGVVFLGLCFAVAWALDRYVDPPMRRWLTRATAPREDVGVVVARG